MLWIRRWRDGGGVCLIVRLKGVDVWRKCKDILRGLGGNSVT